MPAGFVYRTGRKLYIDGKEWRFVGTNDTSLTGCHHGYVPTDAQVDQFFKQFQGNGNVLVRTWGFQHLGSQSAVLQRLDLVTQKAQKYGVKVTIALHEGAEYCGAPDYNQAFYENGYKTTLLPWVDVVTSRYKNSPAIAFWEVSNEAFLKSSGTVAIAKAFMDGVAARIKQNDPNHLVGSGWLASTYGVAGNASGYATIHSGPNIDLCSIHEYDYGYTNGSTAVSPHWGPAADAAYNLNKVAYVGEMGVSKSSGTTAAQRGTDFKKKLDAYFNQPANRLPAGVLYWATLFPPNDSGNSTKSAATNDPNIGGTIIPVIAGYAHANLPKLTGGGSTPPPPDPVDPGDPGDPVDPVGTDTLNDTDAAVTYSAGWGTSEGAGKWNGDDHFTSSEGAWARVAVTGKARVKLYGAKAPHHGVVEVVVRTTTGTVVRTDLVDMVHTSRVDQVLFWDEEIPAGTHTVTMTRQTGTITLDKVVVVELAADPDPPEPEDPTDAERIAALEARITQLEGLLAQRQATITQQQATISRLEDQLRGQETQPQPGSTGYPAGVKTCTLTFEGGIDMRGRPQPASLKVELMLGPASTAVVWEGDGTPLNDFEAYASAREGETGSVTLPVTDQPGWVDDRGGPITGWYYRATLTVGAKQRVKLVQPGTSDTTLDFDTSPLVTVTDAPTPIVPIYIGHGEPPLWLPPGGLYINTADPDEGALYTSGAVNIT